MRLYLIRHPRPIVEDGICYGRTDLAVRQEERQRVLASLLPVLPPQAPVFSSPLQRCLDLARDISHVFAQPEPQQDGRLAEMHFGEWEMLPWSDVPREDIDKWTADLAGYRPGGGECVREVARRVLAFRDDAKALHEHGIIVCHAGTIRLLLAGLLCASAEEAALHAARTPRSIGYGEMIVIDC